MSQKKIKVFILLADLVGLNIAFLFAFWLRYHSGVMPGRNFFTTLSYWDAMLVISVYWLLIFVFFGLYSSWKAQSRFDEILTVAKAVTAGGLILFVLTFDFSQPFPLTRIVLFSYWVALIVTVGTGRTLIRTFQRSLLKRGIGRRKTIIVSHSDKGYEIVRRLEDFPAFGYEVIGFVSDGFTGGKSQDDLTYHFQENRNLRQNQEVKQYLNSNPELKNTTALQDQNLPVYPLLGSVEELPRLVKEQKIEEVLIVSASLSHDQLLNIISQCSSESVTFNIVPELYHIIVGGVRTNQIYGFPLIELMPEFMSAWEKTAKRVIDILVSSIIIAVFSPLWLLTVLAITLDSKGPVFFKQTRVGKNGKRFTMYKFRSMVVGAEKESGPVWAQKHDNRVTRVGRIIRRLKIDEVPQFFNILKGDMSLVGPRPERPFFVERLEKEIPLYNRRLRVSPGLTGWAQIKGRYDTSLEDVREKLKYDFYYIENMSLRMDFKILLRTIWVILTGSGAY